MCREQIIKDPFNYSGNKSKLISIIKDNLPQNCTTLIDLFGGGGCVSLNLADNFERVIYNEKNKYIYGIIKTFSMHSKEFCLDRIKHNINYYQLNKNNKEGFLQFREDFNCLGSQILLSDTFNDFTAQAYLDLYTLIVHSFNYFCTIDKNGKFVNTSGAGRCWFNPSLYKKFVEYKNKLDEIYGKKLFMCNEDFRDVQFMHGKNTFVFVDSPYKVSDDIYSRTAGLEWTEQDDLDLFKLLDECTECGTKWMLTNATICNGKENKPLQEFISKYRTISVQDAFYQCNYQRHNKKTNEVIVVNY